MTRLSSSAQKIRSGDLFLTAAPVPLLQESGIDQHVSQFAKIDFQSQTSLAVFPSLPIKARTDQVLASHPPGRGSAHSASQIGLTYGLR